MIIEPGGKVGDWQPAGPNLSPPAISEKDYSPIQTSGSSAQRCGANIPPEAVDYGGLSGV